MGFAPIPRGLLTFRGEIDLGVGQFSPEGCFNLEALLSLGGMYMGYWMEGPGQGGPPGSSAAQ